MNEASRLVTLSAALNAAEKLVRKHGANQSQALEFRNEFKQAVKGQALFTRDIIRESERFRKQRNAALELYAEAAGIGLDVAQQMVIGELEEAEEAS